ncbi:MAG: helix-turn-helix domain-containing protein, partial [Planctomycetota bacterium]
MLFFGLPMVRTASTQLANAETPRDSVAMLDDPGRLASLLPPLRRRILASLAESPNSAAGLSQKFNFARQKLNYHLRELEKAGFIELASETQRRGCVERSFRAASRMYLIDPAVLGELAFDPNTIQDRFSSQYLLAVASRVVREVSELRKRADAAKQQLATLTLQLDVHFESAEGRAGFAEELASAAAKLAEKYHSPESPSGRTYQFVIAGHPQLKN